MPERVPLPIDLGDRRIGDGERPYVIAELSANHGGKLEQALQILRAAKANGADAIKLQTYTADSMTLPLDQPAFVGGEGSPWAGRNLHDLYAEASLPAEWHAPLFAEAARLDLHCFSTAFESSAVDFLEQFDPVAHKIASFELLDLELVAHAASTGRPLIISTGMATAEEIDDAVGTAQRAGAAAVALLRCNSGYPAPASEMDLRTIPVMIARWGVQVGFSDHSIGPVAAVTAVGLGATLIEKHLTLSRYVPTPDSSFSMEPGELRDLVDAVRLAAEASGAVRFGPSPGEAASVRLRRSLWWLTDKFPGDTVEPGDLRALRPAGGAAPKHRAALIGNRLTRAVRPGDPVSLDDVET